MNSSRHIGTTVVVPDHLTQAQDKTRSLNSSAGVERPGMLRVDEGYRPGSIAASLSQRAHPTASHLSSSPIPASSYTSQLSSAYDGHASISGMRSSSVPRPSSHKSVACTSGMPAAAAGSTSILLQRAPSGTAGRSVGPGGNSILDSSLRQASASGRNSPSALLSGGVGIQRKNSQRFSNLSSGYNYSELGQQVGGSSSTAVRMPRSGVPPNDTSTYLAPSRVGSGTAAQPSSTALSGRLPGTGEQFRMPTTAMPRITPNTLGRTPTAHNSYTPATPHRVLATTVAAAAVVDAYAEYPASAPALSPHHHIDLTSTAPAAMMASERPPLYPGSPRAPSGAQALAPTGTAPNQSSNTGPAVYTRPRSGALHPLSSQSAPGGSTHAQTALPRQYEGVQGPGTSTPRHLATSPHQHAMSTLATAGHYSTVSAPVTQQGFSVAADVPPRAVPAPPPLQISQDVEGHTPSQPPETHHPVTAATITSHRLSPTATSQYQSSSSSGHHAHAHPRPPSAATTSSYQSRSVPASVPPCNSTSTSASSTGAVVSSRSHSCSLSDMDTDDSDPWPVAQFPPLSTLIRDLAPGRGCVGLQNLGNTCFMNSILQMLNASPELVAWCHLDESGGSWKAGVASAYADMVKSMWKAGQSVVSPSAFLRRIARHDSRWGEGSQQDAHEFLHSLLDALQKETNRVTTKPTYRQLDGKGSEEAQAAEAEAYARTWNDSPMDDIFGGTLQSTLQCQACGWKSHCFDPFMGLAVPIPPAPSKARTVSVQDCLKAFVEVEKLDGSESYKCESCKKCCPHTKRLQVWRPPRVLILTLKRFAARNAGGSIFARFRSTAKNSAAVGLDGALDLAPYCNPLGLKSVCRGKCQPVYELAAMSLHSGSLEGGHYTASARSAMDTGGWHHFNDSSVRAENRPSGASSAAYVLLYRLVSPQ